MTWTLSLRVQTEPDCLRAVRRMIYAVVKREGLPDGGAREVELAIGEALSNARAHAYANGVGPLTVDLRYDMATFAVTIHDAGAPISLPAVPTSLADNPRAAGLFLIASLVDDVKIERNGNGQGVSITLTKRLPTPQVPQPGRS